MYYLPQNIQKLQRWQTIVFSWYLLSKLQHAYMSYQKNLASLFYNFFPHDIINIPKLDDAGIVKSRSL